MATIFSAAAVWSRIWPDDEHGQGLAEYGLILALVAVAAIVGLTGLGTGVVAAVTQVTSNL